MRCPKCQFENPPDMQFCGDCAAKLELVCPQCGFPNPATFKFCGKCAHALGGSKPTPPIDYSKPQSYTPKFLADKILKDRSSLEGERKLVTVLFADVANYTAMSGKLDSEECHHIMDGCFQILMDEIHRYEGTINQFTGDGVMALFGAPVAHEDHALRAGYAALAIQKALEGYGNRVNEDCGVEFKMRIGLNSGPVIVGSIGNDLRMDYTAQGDTTNLASRMQGVAEPGSILVAPDTYKMARDFFEFQPLGKIMVKGKEEPVEAYRLLKASGVETRIEASAIRGLTRFVGRESEMESLKEALKKAQAGSGQVVGIVGEAGVGKSRLTLELKRTIPGQEYACLEGHCLHYGSTMPYLPLLDVLRSYFDIQEGEREYLVKKRMAEKIGQLDDKLKAALPPLHDLLSLKVEDEAYLKLEPQKKRERTFEAIRDLLIRESQEKPLVIVIEDLHWVDKTSEEFLNYFIGFLANAHILLILLYRPEYTHQWASRSCYSQIRVDQLPLSTSAELVRSILEEGEVSPDLRELILNRAAGNPFFMEEFTHTLMENGSIGKKDHQYVLTRNASEIQVPDTIQGIIAARMDRLDDNLKRTMQVASVIGRDFAYRILHTITGMKEDLKSYLVNLQGLEFIYEKSLFPELEYVFKHALTQEVAYNSLLLKRRKEIHERIGKAIEELYPTRLEEFCEVLAHHYSRAENWEKAYQYLTLSGSKAGSRYALAEAFRFFKEAIGVLTRLPETGENKRRRIEASLLMTMPMMGLAYPEDSPEIIREGERLARELGDQEALARFWGGMGMYHTMRGDNDLGMRYLEDAFQAAEMTQNLEVLVLVGFQLCSMAMLPGDYLKIADVAPRVISLLESRGKERETFGMGIFNPYSALVSISGYALAGLGNPKEGEAQCQKGLSFATQIKDLASIAYAESMYAGLFMIRGDGGNTMEQARNTLGHSEEAQLLPLVVSAWNYLGWGNRFLGDIKAAVECMKKTVETCQGGGFSGLLPCFYSNLGDMQLELGDLDNARKSAEKALKHAHGFHGGFYEGFIRTYSGSVLGRIDRARFAEAEECVLQGLKMLEKAGNRAFYAYGWLYLGELYADAGKREKALSSLRKAREMMQNMDMDYWLARTQKALKALEG